MTFLDWLFGSRRAAVSSVPSAAAQVELRLLVRFDDEMVWIDSLDFFGVYAKSPSGRYVLCWCDADPAGGAGGQRDKGLGTYVLYDASANAIVLQGRLERPNDGKVADSGAFCLEDWHFGQELSGTFYVFDVLGNPLIRRRFEANLINSAISPLGHYAVCQTAINQDHVDGDRMTVFDVARGIELYSLRPTTGWAKDYRFDESTGALAVQIEGLGSFNYDEKGIFVDAAKFDSACLHSGQFERVFAVARKMLRSSTLDAITAHAILASAQRLCEAGSNQESFQIAKAWRLRGETLEFLGEAACAMEAYDQALRLDSNVGVKRKIDALRKQFPPLES